MNVFKKRDKKDESTCAINHFVKSDKLKKELYETLEHDIEHFIGDATKFDKKAMLEEARQVLGIKAPTTSSEAKDKSSPQMLISAVLPTSTVAKLSGPASELAHYHAQFCTIAPKTSNRKFNSKPKISDVLENRKALLSRVDTVAFELPRNYTGTQVRCDLLLCDVEKCTKMPNSQVANFLTQILPKILLPKQVEKKVDGPRVASGVLTLKHVSLTCDANMALKKIRSSSIDDQLPLTVRIRIGTQNARVKKAKAIEMAILLHYMYIERFGRKDLQPLHCIPALARETLNQFCVHQNMSEIETLTATYIAVMHYHYENHKEANPLSCEDRDTLITLSCITLPLYRHVQNKTFPKSVALELRHAIDMLGELVFWKPLPAILSAVCADFTHKQVILKTVLDQLEDYAFYGRVQPNEIVPNLNRVFTKWDMKNDSAKHPRGFRRTVRLIRTLLVPVKLWHHVLIHLDNLANPLLERNRESKVEVSKSLNSDYSKSTASSARSARSSPKIGI